MPGALPLAVMMVFCPFKAAGTRGFATGRERMKAIQLSPCPGSPVRRAVIATPTEKVHSGYIAEEDCPAAVSRETTTTGICRSGPLPPDGSPS